MTSLSHQNHSKTDRKVTNRHNVYKANISGKLIRQIKHNIQCNHIKILIHLLNRSGHTSRHFSATKRPRTPGPTIRRSFSPTKPADEVSNSSFGAPSAHDESKNIYINRDRLLQNNTSAYTLINSFQCTDSLIWFIKSMTSNGKNAYNFDLFHISSLVECWN